MPSLMTLFAKSDCRQPVVLHVIQSFFTTEYDDYCQGLTQDQCAPITRLPGQLPRVGLSTYSAISRQRWPGPAVAVLIEAPRPGSVTRSCSPGHRYRFAGRQGDRRADQRRCPCRCCHGHGVSAPEWFSGVSVPVAGTPRCFRCAGRRLPGLGLAAQRPPDAVAHRRGILQLRQPAPQGLGHGRRRQEPAAAAPDQDRSRSRQSVSLPQSLRPAG